MTLLALWSTAASAGVRCQVANGTEVEFDGLQEAVNNPLCLTIWLEGGSVHDGFEAMFGLGRDLRIASRNGVGIIEGGSRVQMPLADREYSLTFAHVRFEGDSAPLLDVRRPLTESVVRFEDAELACEAAPCVRAEGAIVELARSSVQATDLEGDVLSGTSGARFRLSDGSRFDVERAANLIFVQDGSVEVRSDPAAPLVFGPVEATAIHADVEQCPDPAGCSVTVDGAWFVGVEGPALDLSGVGHVSLTNSQICGDPDVAVRLGGGSCREGCSVARTAFGPDPGSGVGPTSAILTDGPVSVDLATFRGQQKAVVAAAPMSLVVRGSVIFDGALAGGPVGEVDVSGTLVNRDVEWGTRLTGSWINAAFGPIVAPGWEDEGRQCAELRYHPRMLVDGVEPPTWATRPLEAGVFSGIGPDDDEVAPWRFDCADDDASVHALQVEPPLDNGVDDDCDGLVDCADPDLAIEGGGLVDEDGDGYGRPLADDETACVLDLHDGPDGDCDDADGAIHPGAEELCDEADRDCDGDPKAGATDTIAVWPDEDDDGFGDQGAEPVEACEEDAATGPYATVPGDCDDGDGAVHPNEADAVNDGLDQDCDGLQATALVGGGGCGCAQGGAGGGLAPVAGALALLRRRRDYRSRSSAGSSSTSSPGRAQKS